MNTKELFGKEVLDADANSIGKVADIDVDLKRGVVNHVVVKVGLTKRLVVTLEKIDRIGDKIVLLVKKEGLK